MWCAHAPMLGAMERLRRRRAISTVLALLLAAESVAAVSAAASTVFTARQSTTHALPAASPVGRVLAEDGSADQAPAVDDGRAPSLAPDSLNGWPLPEATPTAQPKAKAPVVVKAPTVVRPRTVVPKAARTPRPTGLRTPTPAPRTGTYTGRNHVWIPSLGVNESVAFFSCSRAAPPSNVVYRWGCAGSNNVYLLGHAYGVFKPVHDAYLNGRLRVGLRVYYADGSGRVHVYAVKWWRLTLPTTDASWAWAPQAAPSMTLQTCMGSNSQYRLMVRLVQVG